MRELKFRAWDTDREEMEFEVEARTDNEFGGLPHLDTMNKGDLYHVMQFTGLLDKNGVEIYEDDVVRVESEGFGEEKFGEMVGKVTWRIDRWQVIGEQSINPLYRLNEFKLTVIGNIYENPELL